MSRNVNRFGLGRRIPESIKREVRRRDGFGCVICGAAIFEYDHFDPEFKDAKLHKTAGIVLLCPRHHRQKGNFLARESIAQAICNPKAKQDGFSRESFDIGSESIDLVFGGVTFKDVTHAVVIDGEPILTVEPPEIMGGPFLLSARFTDNNTTEILHVVKNEWRVSSENWDVEISGPYIEIRHAPGKVVLRLRSEPPARLIIERLEMVYRGQIVRVQDGGLAEFRGSEGSQIRLDGEMTICGFNVAVSFEHGRIVIPTNLSDIRRRLRQASVASNTNQPWSMGGTFFRAFRTLHALCRNRSS